MINWIHSLFHRPEKGWDPIPPEYASVYAKAAYERWDERVLDRLEHLTGGLAGKEVLDLAAGPGQCSISFALRGARVTWYDVSAGYKRIASQAAEQRGAKLEYVMGYMDEAEAILRRTYDIVFNRVSWYYGMSDAGMAKTIYRLLKPGGVGYVETGNAEGRSWSLSRRMLQALNKYCSIKIGHPYPPHGRIADLFSSLNVRKMMVDYSDPRTDIVMFVKDA